MRPPHAGRLDGVLRHLRPVHRRGAQQPLAGGHQRDERLTRSRQQNASVGREGGERGAQTVAERVVVVHANVAGVFGGKVREVGGVEAVGRVQGVQVDGGVGEDDVGVKDGIVLDVAAAEVQEPCAV